MLSLGAEASTATPDGEVRSKRRSRNGCGAVGPVQAVNQPLGAVREWSSGLFSPRTHANEPSNWRMSGEMAERNERQTEDWFLRNAPIVKGQSNATVGSWHGDQSNQPVRCGALPA